VTRLLRYGGAGLLVIAVGTAAVLLWREHLYRQALEARGSGAARVVEVQKGWGSGAIAGLLAREGLIREASAFRRYVRETGLASQLKAGYYELSPSMSIPEVAAKIARGEVIHKRITIPEGFTLEQIAQRAEREKICAAQDFRRAASDRARIKLFGLAGADARDLEGFLFPDTYTLPYDVTAEGFVDAMLKRFKAALPELPKEAACPALRTWKGVVTLASLVEAEAKADEERALIAGVYVARLKRGMKLECDATVQYALPERKARLLFADLEIDSPYNTYKHKGLPPGPICSPGEKSLRAAARPEKTDYLYYVARPDGRHVFSRTFAEHQAAIKRIRGQ